MKLLAALVWTLALGAGCAAARANFTLVTPAEQCTDQGSACIYSHECCSMWCVYGYCERREP
ncbi:MAG TPA: hypothetical protein VIA18_14530 [Polyangia bacterium]|jgi:hypothetical protein|nr:hypothetical protein [Polyangia bacterium]